MFYRLQSNYALRGWDGVAWILVHRPDNQAYPLSQQAFQVLTLCDGITDLTQDQLGPRTLGGARQVRNQRLCAALRNGPASEKRPVLQIL